MLSGASALIQDLRLFVSMSAHRISSDSDHAGESDEGRTSLDGDWGDSGGRLDGWGMSTHLFLIGVNTAVWERFIILVEIKAG